MQIKYFDTLSSTHTHLKDYIKAYGYTNPICFVTKNQTKGQGSRDNLWDGKDGNLFFSFVTNSKLLPKDLPIQSASIYFTFIFKEVLSNLGSNVMVKWPNDLYIDNKKIGGTITNMNNQLFYCGIGLNLIEVNDMFGCLDIGIDINNILDKYFLILEKCPSWKQIFSKYEIEFHKKNEFKTQNVFLKDALLQADGSLLVNSKRVFSLR